MQLLVDGLVGTAKHYGTAADTVEVQGHLYRYAQLLQEHPHDVDSSMDFRRRLHMWGLQLPTVSAEPGLQGVPEAGGTGPPTPFKDAAVTGASASPAQEQAAAMLGGLADTLPVSDLREHSFANIPFADVEAFHEADTAQARMVLSLVDAHTKAVAAVRSGVHGVFADAGIRALAQPTPPGLWRGYMHQVGTAHDSRSLQRGNEGRLQAWLPTAARASAAQAAGATSWLGSALGSASAAGVAPTSTKEPSPSLGSLGLADPGLACSGLARSARTANEETLHSRDPAAASAPAPAAAPAPSMWSFAGWRGESRPPASPPRPKEPGVAAAGTAAGRT